MRNSLRVFALLLCLIQLATVVFATEPGLGASASDPDPDQTPTVSQTEDPAAPSEPDHEPVDIEPTDPEPITEPATEPVTEPDPTESVPTEPTQISEPEAQPQQEQQTEPESEPEPEPEPETPVWEMTDEEIIAKYSIKNNWARNGLIFAVRNGILAGKGNNNLCPKDKTTHAELATMLMGILRTQKRASLSRFTDVRAKDWFAEPLSKAVSLGIFPIANPNATTLTPKTYITREEAYVAIARVFGVHGNGRQSIYRFSDWKEVSDWAAEDLSAMIDAGLLGGNDGKIMPKNQITRQELAVILSGLLTRVSTGLDTESFTGRLALAADAVPDGATIDGDLLLSTDETNIKLKNVTVTGRLVLQGNDTVNLRLTQCSIGELVLCRPANLYSNQTVSNVISFRSLTLNCHGTSIQAYGPLVLKAGYTVDTISAMNNATVTVDGTAKNVKVIGDNVTVNGSGTVKKLHQHGIGLINSCKTESVTGAVRNTPENVTALRTESTVPSSTSPTATLKLKLQNMPEGWSECDLIWYVNGKEIARVNRTLCKEETVVSQNYNFSQYLDGTYEKVNLTLYTVIGGYKKKVYSGDVKLNPMLSVLVKQVRTQNVQAKLIRNVTLYKEMELTGALGTYSSGTQVTVLQSRHSSYTMVRMPNGAEGWVDYDAVQIINDKYYTTTDYTTAIKEYYVNHVRNCTSQTNYLIWVSLYPQRINIFKGSKGNWKLIRSGPIASGRNECPTPAEVTTIRYKTPEWNYTNYYCHHVSVFDEARGFHSRPTSYEGYIYDSSIGYPASAGCVRLMDEDCVFIYDNCPVGTAVYIY